MFTVLQCITGDFRYALRRMRNDAGFTLAAAATIALAVGFTTAMFSLANAVWLRPLAAFSDPDRLVAIERPYFPGFPLTTWASVPDFLDWRDRTHSFADMAMAATDSRHLILGDGARKTNAFFVSANFFSVLGVKPIAGRTFLAGEDRNGAPPVVVLGEDLWRSVFAANPSVVGQTLTLRRWEGDRTEYQVVGIVPRDVRIEYDLEAWTNVGLFVPYTDWPADRANRMHGGIFNRVYARLRTGVTPAQAQAEMVSLCAALKREFPKDRRPPAVRVMGLHDELLGGNRPVVLMLMAAAALVLLIGCANVASLLVARMPRRSRDLAIRAALGATRGQLVREQLVESLAIAIVGGLAGSIAASWALSALLAAAPPALARVGEVKYDFSVACFAIGLSAVTGVVVCLLPALRAATPRLAETLKAGGRTFTAPTGWLSPGSGSRLAHAGRLLGTRPMLVLLDLSLVVLLVIVAGLMTRSLFRMVMLDVGFDPHGVVIVDLNGTEAVRADPVRWAAVERALADRVRSLGGVSDVAITDVYPFPPFPRALSTVALENGREVQALVCAVDGRFAELMKVPVVTGRFLASPADDDRAIAVVSRSFAARYLGNGATVGRRIHLRDRWMDVVGATGDVTEMGSSVDIGKGDTFVFGRTWKGLQASTLPTVYVPRSVANATMLLIRTVRAADLSAAVRAAIAATNPELSMGDVTTLDERIGRTLADTRFYASVMAVFSLVAMLLAAVGVHGVVGQTVARRRSEIGVRTALGAKPAQVVSLVLGQTLTAAVAGIACGVMLAWWITRAMGRFLFGVAPNDPWTYAAAIALLVVVAAFAAFRPARRAARIDPAEVLRAE